MKRLLLILVLAWSTANAGSIGNSNVSGSNVAVGGGCWYYQRVTADSNATTDSMLVYGNYGASGDDTMYVAFYAPHATYDTLPGALLWVGRPDSTIMTSSAAWHKITMTGITLVAGTKYWMAWGGRSVFNMYRTNGTTASDSTYGGNRCVGFNAGAFVDPSGATSSAIEAKRGVQIFYTTSGGGGPSGGGNGLRALIQNH